MKVLRNFGNTSFSIIALTILVLGFQNCSNKIEGFIVPADTTIVASEIPPGSELTETPAPPSEEGSGPAYPTDPAVLSDLRVYFDFAIVPSVLNGGLSKKDAMADCERNFRQHEYGYPNGSTLCTWRTEVIFEKFNGECSTTQNVCRRGKVSEIPSGGSSITRWSCLGTGGGIQADCQCSGSSLAPTDTFAFYLDGGTTPTSIANNLTEQTARSRCSGYEPDFPGRRLKCTWGSVVLVDKAAAGQCSTSINACRIGFFSDLSDTSTTYRWTCTGMAGGATISCDVQMSDSIPLNTLRMYTGASTSPSTSTPNISEAEALSKCISIAKANPGTLYKCTWGTAILMDGSKGMFPPLY
ncbi:MAG: hypothetical protein IPK04_08370 [Bdellovibrionales bacterium]|nr:hypothetical protein [Bdellovibrionales bacterium]